jgi:hypothetical protein
MEIKRHGLAVAHATIACIFASILQLGLALAAEQPSTAANEPDEGVVEEILVCLSDGMEAVLLPDKVVCKRYLRGVKYLEYLSSWGPQWRAIFFRKDITKVPHKLEMPLKRDANEACKEEGPKDWRRLSEHAIKRIASKQDAKIDPFGIRIIGAVFCERLDLIGLDLTYALVIDGSIFRHGFEARNFHTRADFSFEKSVAFEKITISRSRVEGSIYGEDAYLESVQILDSEVHGSIILRRTILPKPAVFDTVSVTGELSVRESALTSFLLQFSKVGGVLDLTASQARCAYVISESEIEALFAVGAGFGTTN